MMTLALLVCVAECRDSWELLTASKARGTGTFVPNVETEDQCLNTCLLNIRCVAVDVKVSVSPYQCYIHTNQSEIANPLYTEEYKLYVLLIRCNNINSSLYTSSPQTALGQNGRGQNGTDKMAPIESSTNQAIQLPLTI